MVPVELHREETAGGHNEPGECHRLVGGPIAGGTTLVKGKDPISKYESKDLSIAVCSHMDYGKTGAVDPLVPIIPFQVSSGENSKYMELSVIVTNHIGEVAIDPAKSCIGRWVSRHIRINCSMTRIVLSEMNGRIPKIDHGKLIACNQPGPVAALPTAGDKQ